MIQELLATVETLVTDALKAAGNFAEETVDQYVKPALDATQSIYDMCLAQGMKPEDAADMTERILRDITGRVII